MTSSTMTPATSPNYSLLIHVRQSNLYQTSFLVNLINGYLTDEIVKIEQLTALYDRPYYATDVNATDSMAAYQVLNVRVSSAKNLTQRQGSHNLFHPL